MVSCGHRAVLVITHSVEGTATSVARQRIELFCQLPPGHEGEHRDLRAGEMWTGTAGKVTTLLRDETETE